MIDALTMLPDATPTLPPELAALLPLAWIAIGLVMIRLLSEPRDPRSWNPFGRAPIGPLSQAPR